MFLTPILIILPTLCVTYAKIYGRCELARELRNFDLPEDEIPTWVCIAQHESNYDTAAMNPGSGDHGLFQISQIYWCSPPGYGCNTPCEKFRDDDIDDDLQCVRRIYKEHTRISGNGFNAWVVYKLHCDKDNSRYIQGCFDNYEPPAITVNVTDNEIPDEAVDEFGDGYQFPPLPRSIEENSSYTVDSVHKDNFSKQPYSRISITDAVFTEDGDNLSETSDSADGYEFPKLPFSRISKQSATSVKGNRDGSKTPTSYRESSTTTTTPIPLRQRLTTRKPSTTESLDEYELKGASSTVTPFRSAYKPFATTSKPISTFKPVAITTSNPFVTQIPKFSPVGTKFATQTKNNFASSNEFQTTTTKKPFTFQPFATSKHVPNLTPDSPAPPKIPYAPTATPVGKQLTFAPDSFFSLIFGSQTLPPIVAPPRPPRPSGARPPGGFGASGGLQRPTIERPSVNERPRPERPGGLPRPPRPERPGGVRPSTLTSSNQSEIEAVPGQGHNFGRPPLRRPLGPGRPFSTKNHPGGLPRPFTRKPVFERRTELPVTSSLPLVTTSVSKIHAASKVESTEKQVAIFGGLTQNTSATTKTPTSITGKSSSITTKTFSGISRSSRLDTKIDEPGVEVKLDNNFVFLRTKFGYRLFRNERK